MCRYGSAYSSSISKPQSFYPFLPFCLDNSRTVWCPEDGASAWGPGEPGYPDPRGPWETRSDWLGAGKYSVYAQSCTDSRVQLASCSWANNRTGDTWQQTGHLEENNLCELGMKDKGGCWLQSYLWYAPFLCLACSTSVHITCKSRWGIQGSTRFGTKKLCKIPENSITFTINSPQDAHWGTGVCFFP